MGAGGDADDAVPPANSEDEDEDELLNWESTRANPAMTRRTSSGPVAAGAGMRNRRRRPPGREPVGRDPRAAQPRETAEVRRRRRLAAVAAPLSAAE